VSLDTILQTSTKGHSYGVKVHARLVSIDRKLLRSKFDAPAALGKDEVSATREETLLDDSRGKHEDQSFISERRCAYYNLLAVSQVQVRVNDRAANSFRALKHKLLVA